MKYLIITAHPDDEVLGCGGSIAKWSKNGYEVHVLIMAEGITSREKKRGKAAHQKELSYLAQSSKKASKILGVQSLKLLEYPDNRMDSVNLLDIVKSIEEHIEKVKPGGVVTHHSGDLNIDHQIIHPGQLLFCCHKLVLYYKNKVILFSKFDRVSSLGNVAIKETILALLL